MKKYIVLAACLITLGSISVPLHGMSPAAMRQKQQAFDTKLRIYIDFIRNLQGNTTEALAVAKQAQEIINQLAPYTTTTTLQHQLRRAMAAAGRIYETQARFDFDSLVNFFGKKNSVGTFTSEQQRKNLGADYYNNTAQAVMKDAYKLLKRMYPTNTGDRSGAHQLTRDPWFPGQKYLALPTSARNQPSPTDRIIEHNKNEGLGGAFYWIQAAMNRANALLNIFGTTNDDKPYGTDIKNFVESTDVFLQELHTILEHMYPRNRYGDSFAKQNNTLQLPYDHKKLPTIRQVDKNMGLFDHLNRDLSNYSKFIHDILGAQNITDALEKMNKAIKGSTLSIPKKENNKLITQERRFDALSTYNRFEDFFVEFAQAISAYQKGIVAAAESEVLDNIKKESDGLHVARKQVENRIEEQEKQLERQLKEGSEAISLFIEIQGRYQKLLGPKVEAPADFEDKTLETWITKNRKATQQFIFDAGVALMSHMKESITHIERKEVQRKRIKSQSEAVLKAKEELEELEKEFLVQTPIGLEMKEQDITEAEQRQLEEEKKKLENEKRILDAMQSRAGQLKLTFNEQEIHRDLLAIEDKVEKDKDEFDAAESDNEEDFGALDNLLININEDTDRKKKEKKVNLQKKAKETANMLKLANEQEEEERKIEEEEKRKEQEKLQRQAEERKRREELGRKKIEEMRKEEELKRLAKIEKIEKQIKEQRAVLGRGQYYEGEHRTAEQEIQKLQNQLSELKK